MLLRYGTKIGRPAEGTQFVSEINASSNLYRNHPGAFPANTSNSMCAGTALSVLSVFRPEANRVVVLAVFTHDGTRLSGRRACNNPSSAQNLQNMRRGPGMSKPRAPSLAMDDAFRAGTSYTTKTSVSRDDARYR